jgi:transcriptional regulator with XRE-family HTH domain
MVAGVAKRKPGRKPGKPRVFDGAKLRALRTAQEGLTQAKLAEQVGVHEVDVSRYERGEVDPSLHTLVNLARVLGVEMKDLLKTE